MIIGNKKFDTSNHYIMGIVNLTPDSFSDGGRYNDMDQALKRIEQMIENGADIIDIGGESTRPGHVQISDEEEIRRILPIIKAIKARFDIPVSLDTYKSGVVKAALGYVDIVNDIHGLKADPQLAKIIATNNLACCIMHNRNNQDYDDFFDDLQTDLKQSLAIAKAAGIAPEQIMIDAGIGFAKTYQQNLVALNRTAELVKMGYPVLIATSKKGFIGQITGSPVDQRIAGTVATTVIGALKGATFFRVHDVKANKDALKMTEAVVCEQLD